MISSMSASIMGDLPGIDQFHFCPYRIHADDFMAFFRKASCANGAYITETEYADSQDMLLFYWLLEMSLGN